MKEYIFEMDYTSTEQTTIKAESLEVAEEIMLSGNCRWEEIKSQGGDWECVQENEI
tara:strand:+ start:20 stop:187 length:168 start_codon:yes stop_codon:yes gene_type:complete